ncbi:tobH protein [Skermania piniformis]|uniref:TobH protein n=1 Tax=Skermania pinensis TaxID=39122 RepID=A0ABX8S5Z1_9ACTN|nr:tobH protein [Skermania piniformis]QXQ13270.1 tobH protein [Skermania piniformis]
MTALSPVVDLDDVDSLEAADTTGALRSAASAGAQVRAIAGDIAESTAGRLADLRPRSVVLVSGSGRPARAAALLSAALADRVSLPIVPATATPSWIGPLDVVLVAGDDAGDLSLAESVDRALRHGAEVVVAAPADGPLRVAGSGRAVLLPARVPVPDHNTLSRYLAAGLGVLAAVDGGRNRALLPDLGRLADALDAEAMRDRPGNEVFHNPAKSLAARMQNRRVMLSGDDAAAAVVARHGVEVLARCAGRVAAGLDLVDALAAADVVTAADRPPGFDPLFHDEELDGPAPGQPARLFVMSTSDDPLSVRRRIARFDDAEVVSVVVEESPPGAPGDASGPGTPVEQLATLSVRLELAAVYLRLVEGSGQAGGKGEP